MIPFTKPTISKKDLVHVLECMLTDRVEPGELERRFEREFAIAVGGQHGVALHSAGAAYFMIFRLLGIEEGDEVVLPAYASPLLLEVLRFFKAVARPVDLCEESYVIDASKIAGVLTERTKAVIVSHTFGFPAEIPEALLESKEWALIEDCTHSMGTRVGGALLGAKGRFSVHSTDADGLITTAKGALVVCRQKRDADLLRDRKSFAMNETVEGRMDLGMSDLLAAMGISELSLMDKFLSRRKEIAEYYSESLRRGVNRRLASPDNAEMNNLWYPILPASPVKNALELFKKYKVQAVSPYPKPIFEHLGLPEADFPHARNAQLKTLCVPLYPVLRKEEVETVGKLLANIR